MKFLVLVTKTAYCVGVFFGESFLVDSEWHDYKSALVQANILNDTLIHSKKKGIFS